MAVYSHTFTVSTRAGLDVHDITTKVQDIIDESGLEAGIVCVFVPGSTAGITTIEYESGVISDLIRAIDRAAPENIHYAHDDKWHDGNGHSHVRSALIGPSFSAPFIDGRIMLGTWQQIVLLNFDNRDRNRTVIIQILGE